MSKDDEITKKGPITEYRPHKDDVSGGSDKSVQAEALGAEGSADLQTTGSTSGGSAGRIENLNSNQPPRRDGGERDDVEKGGITR